jgi:UPF0271 protein
MEPRSIDLNADVGEGFGTDDALLQIVTSANVACGFHAGDTGTMRDVCRIAVGAGVAIGAQPSYRDREGFGRRDVEVGTEQLVADLCEQVEALREAAAEAGGAVRYLKPHGALYHRAGHDDAHAEAVVEACRRYDLPVLALPGSRLLALAAEAGLGGYREYFADRAYGADGRLVPRSEPGAVLTDPDEVARRVRAMAGGSEALTADSVCVHGDSPGAVRLARATRSALVSVGVQVRSFR